MHTIISREENENEKLVENTTIHFNSDLSGEVIISIKESRPEYSKTSSFNVSGDAIKKLFDYLGECNKEANDNENTESRQSVDNVLKDIPDTGVNELYKSLNKIKYLKQVNKNQSEIIKSKNNEIYEFANYVDELKNEIKELKKEIKNYKSTLKTSLEALLLSYEDTKKENKELKDKLKKLETIARDVIENDDLKEFYKDVMGEIRRDKYGIVGKGKYKEANCGICVYNAECPEDNCPLNSNEYYIKKHK